MLFSIKINDEGFTTLTLYTIFRKFNYKRHDCSQFYSLFLIANFHRHACTGNCNYFLSFFEGLVRQLFHMLTFIVTKICAHWSTIRLYKILSMLLLFVGYGKIQMFVCLVKKWGGGTIYYDITISWEVCSSICLPVSLKFNFSLFFFLNV